MALQKHKISLSEEQWERLSAVSKKKHMSVSALVRQLVDDWVQVSRKETENDD